MTIIDYKEKSGLYYSQIAEATKTDKSRVCNRMRHTAPGPLEWFIEAAAVVGMPVEEAIEEWNRESKPKRSRRA